MQLNLEMVHHQFDDRMYAHCLQHQQQQQQHAQHRQPSLTVTRQYTVGPATSTSTASDYVMYTGSGNAAGDGDIAARSPTSTCHRHSTVSYVTDAAPTNHHQYQPPSSSSSHHQQHIYYRDYHHQLGSKCVTLGPGENDQTGPVTTSWSYPSATGDADAGEVSPTEWHATIGRAYSRYMPADDSLDLLHHQLLNPDRTSLTDNACMYQLQTSCDIPATATVTTATKYRLQPEPDAVGAISVVKQHLIDIESRAHHVHPGESTWTQSEPAFDWMKKQAFSPVTMTGTHNSGCFCNTSKILQAKSTQKFKPLPTPFFIQRLITSKRCHKHSSATLSSIRI